MRRAMQGKRVCSKDGGKSLQGIAHPNFKTGRYTRSIPQKLLPAFERAINDPDLLALNQDIATVEAMIDDTLRTLETGDLAALFGEVRTLWSRLWPAVQREDREAVTRIRDRLGDLILLGASEALAVAKFLELTEQKRRLTESESRRREKMQEYLRAEDAAISYKALAMAVRNNVKDRDVLSSIADEFARIAGLAAIPGPQPPAR